MGTDDSPSPFARLLRQHRQATGLTQEEPAHGAQLTGRTIGDLERGLTQPPCPELVASLAEVPALRHEERVAFEAAACRPSPAVAVPAATEERGIPVGAGATLPTGMLTFLIADVRGYTAYTHRHGDEAGARLATRFAALAEEAVVARDGHLVEIRGDEVLAVFTSARKALRAAVDLLTRCAGAATPELPLRAGVGLDVGEPISVPGGYRGEAINVAARLCAQAAPGEALASEGVVHLARRIEGLAYEKRGALALKGISRPIRTWLVRVAATIEGEAATPVQDRTVPDPPAGPQQSSLSALPQGGYLGAVPGNKLVAREAERAHIADALDAVAAGHGRLVLLAGEPGVGKTRLAQEAMLTAREHGLHILVGRCYEQDTALPFSLFLEALTSAAGLGSPALRAALPERYGDLGLLLPGLVPPPAVPPGEDPRRRVFAAVSGFLAALAGEAPLAVLLDDLHWADSASIELLHHLSRTLRGAPVFLLGTYRDVEVGRRHPLRGVLTALTRERLLDLLKLQGLSPAGTAALICARFATAEVSDELRDLVHGRTDGNPFFTEELLTALVEQGAIYREGEGWERKEVAEIDLPESVRAVVGQRVERLGEGAQEVLRVASVLGQEWDLDLLLGAVEADEAVVLDHLEAALGARLLEERRGERRERYAFAHALVAQVLYDEVPRFRLRRLHRRAGEALERARGARPEVAAELTRHFLAGGDEERALRYALLAGDHAAGLYAHAEAMQHYQTVLELQAEQQGGTAEAAAAVRRKLGGVLVSLQRTASAVRAYEEARQIYEQTGDLAGQADVERELGWAYQTVADFTAALPHLERAMALWPTGEENSRLVRLLLETARARSLTGQAAAAQALAEQGSALAERLGEPALQAEGLVERALAAGSRGALRQALALLEEAEPPARRSGARYILFRLFNNRGESRRFLGESRAGLADFRQAATLGEELGLLGPAAVARANEAEVCLQLGAWAEGRAAGQTALAYDGADQYGVAPLLAWMTGDTSGALTLARRALEAARRRQHTEMEATTLQWLADWQLDLGEVAAALAGARAALALAWPVGAAAASAALAEAAVRTGAADAPTLLAEAFAVMERDQQYRHLPRLLRARGLLLERQGDASGALASLVQSAAAARAQEALLDLGRTLAALAEQARAAGNEAQAAEAEAERAAIVERIGPEVHGLAWARLRDGTQPAI
jgi:class 3 adenylate cyclase/tetratricopeptide (TPR) repeat protein/DNA-binding XRE family transcriptional regulator